MKTDLKIVLSVSGQSGLFKYLAQATNGIIAESYIDGHRTMFGSSARISTLADISIYTDEGEMSLMDVFESMHECLGDEHAPSKNSDSAQIKAFFAKVVPSYDSDRFYLSHMKKVVEWYNILKDHASLDFVKDEDEADDTKNGEELEEN